MKDQYAGDIGDYFKLSLLRALMPGHSLGVSWFRTANDPSHANDGAHTGYLFASGDNWRRLDPIVFDRLRAMVVANDRSILALQRILDDAPVVFDDVQLDDAIERTEWLRRQYSAFHSCSLIFLDPDNGIAVDPPANGKRSAKHVYIDELEGFLSFSNTLVVYHHHTHRRGGHLEELKYIGDALFKARRGTVLALRASTLSPRSFFIVDPTTELKRRVIKFAEDWSPHVALHRLVEVDTLGLPDDDPYSDRAERALLAFGRRVDAGQYDRYFRRKPSEDAE